MIWKKMCVVSQEQTGEDLLGNPLYGNVDGNTYNVRFTPWTDEQIAVEGRDITKNEQRYIVPCSRENFPDCKLVRIGDDLFEVKSISNLSPRWTLIQVRKYR